MGTIVKRVARLARNRLDFALASVGLCRRRELLELHKRHADLHYAIGVHDDAIVQTLGKALGFPWYKDDPEHFPDATEADGIFPGIYVAEDVADLAARELMQLREAEWLPVGPAVPLNRWLETWREGESHTTLAYASREPEPGPADGELIWTAPSGHDTVMNSGSYAPPTHYRLPSICAPRPAEHPSDTLPRRRAPATSPSPASPDAWGGAVRSIDPDDIDF